MKTLRKKMLPALAAIMACMLTACSASQPGAQGTPSAEEGAAAASEAQETGTETSLTEISLTGEEASQTEASQAEASQSESTDIRSGESVLIAYFSHTGNTEEAAMQIADLTGGTLAEIQRAEEYDDLQEEAEAEILEGSHPEITVSMDSGSLDSIEEYDTIFVGYPIWWDEAPAMIATFLDSYDFAGKTIVPFCTSSSDSIDNSLHIFDELCPDAVIVEGLTANDLSDVEPWLQELGLLSGGGAETASPGGDGLTEAADGSGTVETAQGKKIRMTSGDVEVMITLNDSWAAVDLANMLPLEMTLIERNEFAKGMTLPRPLATDESTTREYEIGDFGYWAAGPDLAIFYDDIYAQTIVPVIPLGKADANAESMRNTSGTVRLELIPEEDGAV